MRIASIDIGTNTILLLIAEFGNQDSPSSLVTIADEMVVARLGKGVDEHRKILPPTFERVRNYLQKYITTAATYSAERMIAVGTSALRDAVNRSVFLEYIRKETGLAIRILSGEEEARLTFIGALSEFESIQTQCGVIDIGGGSTEIVTGTRETAHSHQSIDVGSVRLTERFLLSSPPDDSQLDTATRFIRSTFLQSHLPSFADKPLVGVAGTVTTLASLELNLASYDREKVRGYSMSLETIDAQFARLRPLNLEQIKAIPQIAAGRADIILAGILILREFMRITGSRSVITSDRGLRYGVVIEEYKRAIKN